MHRPVTGPLAALDQETTKRAAIVLAMMEAASHPEPLALAPGVATALRARKPSEMPPRIIGALLPALSLQADLEARAPDVVKALAAEGMSEAEAALVFEAQVRIRRWKAIATAYGGHQ